MSLFTRKPKLPVPDDLPARMRSVSRRLTGWTTTGTGCEAPDHLLDEGARAIESLAAELALLREERP